VNAAPGAVQIATLSGDDAGSHCDAVVDAYRRAWKPTPFWPGRGGVREFVPRFLRHSANPGFRLCLGTAGDKVVGFSYGYTSVPGGWWREIVAAELPADEARYWFEDCFELAELAVVPEHRRRGLGQALHDQLLGGLPHRTALLSTQMENAPAARLYTRLGWSVIQTDFSFPNRPHPYLIMGIALK
jgi:ribosomal protein S18 acetylase RimI-like enzyme